MVKKAFPTRTLNPLPFQDLDPHRFEDLVRNLIYEFRNWSSIEATGRAGGDEGFDVRAWENTKVASNDSEEDDETGTHPIEGNVWKIQCKREKNLGPSRIREIVNEGVDSKSPPYGYILVASAVFSKKSHDIFRSELRARGVMEFQLWGRPTLEDMLFLPKNDSILFAFFGISLVTKRRQRSTEIKFGINNKNRLFRILAEGNVRRDIHHPVLLRDFKDAHYPWKGEYEDFEKVPRWKEYSAVGFDPQGLMLDVRRSLAFVDVKKKQYDFCRDVNLLVRQSEAFDQPKADLERRIRTYWRYLPRANQAELHVKGIVSFEDILLIDEKGNPLHAMPHIFVDFKGEMGPFRWLYGSLVVGTNEIELDDSYEQIAFFPSTLEAPKPGKKHTSKLELDDETARELGMQYSARTLFDVSGRYDFLGQRDIIEVALPESSRNPEKTFIEITHRHKTSLKEYLPDNPGDEVHIERQIGRKVKDSEDLAVLEFRIVNEWDLEGE